jgi:hypothetical protein
MWILFFGKRFLEIYAPTFALALLFKAAIRSVFRVSGSFNTKPKTRNLKLEFLKKGSTSPQKLESEF